MNTKIDDISWKILKFLQLNARESFAHIGREVGLSAPAVAERVKKMEDEGIIQGSTLTLNYEKMGYSFIAHVGIFLEKTSMTQNVIRALRTIPNVTVAYVTAGKYNIFCKVRAKDTNNAKDIIYMIDDIDGVSRTETMISLEESINDKKRMMHAIFKEM